jgi:hypothetical protein
LVNFIESERSEGWNEARSYSLSRIIRVLNLCDELVIVAEFGDLEFDRAVTLPEQFIINKRIDALKRFCSHLFLLIHNSKFNLSAGGLEEVEELRDKLYKVKEHIPKCEIKKLNQINKRYEITINEPVFYNCLEDLKNIMENLIVPLNQAGFIFPRSDAIDPDELKRQIVEGG